jgi:hypothetical protein
MADAAAARNEDHGGGTDGGHKEGIVIGATDHSFGAEVEVAAGFENGFDKPMIANRRPIHIQALDLQLDTATETELAGSLFDFFEDGIPGLDLSIAQIDLEPGAIGDAVDGPRFNPEHAGSAYRIGTAAGFHGGLDG